MESRVTLIFFGEMGNIKGEIDRQEDICFTTSVMIGGCISTFFHDFGWKIWDELLASQEYVWKNLIDRDLNERPIFSIFLAIIAWR